MVIIQAKPIASELLAQHAVLFFEVVDYVALVLVQLAGEGNQQQDGIWYGHLAREEHKDLKFLRNGTVRYRCSRFVSRQLVQHEVKARDILEIVLVAG